MKTLTEFLKDNNLEFADDNYKSMFENHINEFLKRLESGEKLEVEMDETMLSSLDESLIKRSDELIKFLTDKKIEQYDLERFLIATHIMMLKEI